MRVIEIGHYAAGYAGRLFVRQGADVVRLEPDVALPGWASKAAMDTYLHAGKRRVRTDDQRLRQALIATADVVVCEGVGAYEVESWSFADWQNPAKIALTPFGLTGPKRNWQASPNVILAMGGYTHLMGDADKAPLTLPGHFLEFQTGALAHVAANAALLSGGAYREADISMLETLMTLSQFTTVRWHCAGEVRSRHGSDFWFVAPSDLFACRDGWVYINIVPSFWDAFTLLLERPELLLDERFTNNDLRMANREVLYPQIGAVFADMTRQEIEQRAEEYRVPLGVMRTLDDVLAEPHLAQRGFWEEIEGLRSPGTPYLFNDNPRPTLALHETTTGAELFDE